MHVLCLCFVSLFVGMDGLMGGSSAYFRLSYDGCSLLLR